MSEGQVFPRVEAAPAGSDRREGVLAIDQDADDGPVRAIIDRLELRR